MEKIVGGRTYRDGEIICSQGEPGDCMYIIQKGRVELLHEENGQEFSLSVLEAGDFWGQSGLLEPNHLRTATAKAVGEAVVASLGEQLFLARIQEDPTFVLRVMGKMSQRVHELYQMLVRTGMKAWAIEWPIPSIHLD
jgi:CRP-like cAMP-binding protein